MSEQPAHRVVIPATCQLHGGAVGFTNLVLTQVGDSIVFDPHAVASCVISVDRTAARQLYQTLGEWLG
ncbi:MAG: hypothetical protein ACREX8_03330 [Gammaproteobacteria bacterium]